MRAWLVTIIVALATVVTSSAAASTPAEVDISHGVASSELPLGSPFVLSLKVPDKTSVVYALAVQYAFGALGSKAGSEVDSCRELQKFLGEADERKLSGTTGETTLGNVIAVLPEKDGAKIDAGSLGQRPAFLLTPWKRDSNATEKETHAKLHFPKTSFFKRGAHYCLLTVDVTVREETQTVVTEQIDSLSDDVANCADENCKKSVYAKLATLKLTAKQDKTLKDHLGEGINLRRSAQRAVPIFEEGQSRFEADVMLQPNVTGGGRLLLHVSHKANRPKPDPAGEMIALVLLRAGFLEEEPANRGEFVSKDGKWDLLGISIDDQLRLSGTFQKKGTQGTTRIERTSVFDVDVKDLALPGNAGVTLRKFLLFVRGRLQIGTEMVSFKELAARAAKIRPSQVGAPEKTFWPAVHQELVQLEAFAGFATRAAARAPKPDANGEAGPDVRRGVLTDPLLELAGKWFEEKRLVLFDEVGESGLAQRLVVASSDVVSALARWDADKTKVKETIREIGAVKTTDAQFGFTPDTWFLTYVTPMLGYALTRDDFDVYALNLQFHLFPNSADEPMWTNGFWADLRRMPSLQLGIAPKTGNFGPNDRFSGPGDLPPLMVGLGLQVIPYTVISSGVMFVDAKRSTLDAETAYLRVAPYIAFSVNVNIPDIVKTAFQGKSTKAD